MGTSFPAWNMKFAIFHGGNYRHRFSCMKYEIFLHEIWDSPAWNMKTSIFHTGKLAHIWKLHLHWTPFDSFFKENHQNFSVFFNCTNYHNVIKCVWYVTCFLNVTFLGYFYLVGRLIGLIWLISSFWNINM